MSRSLSFCAIVLFFATSANAAVLELTWNDPTLDHTNGSIDLIGMSLTFDNTTGDYEIHANFNPAFPFSNPSGAFYIVNLNLYNTTNPNEVTLATPNGILVSVPSFFDFVVAPTTQLIITGNHSEFTSWQAGDAISNSSSIATPGVTFGTGVQNGGQGLDGLEPALVVILEGAPCPWDLNGDGMIGSSDLSFLLGDWGNVGGAADFDGGGVGSSDLSQLLGAWGPCPG